MTASASPKPDPQWPAWFAAAARDDVRAAVDAIHADLDAAVTEGNPTCWVSGRCCHFNAFGHRLYVTALETAIVLHRVNPLRDIDLAAPCAFQHEGLCGIHALRPLGCRVFFCQEGKEQWQRDLYEQFQSRLRQLHDAHHIPYRYLEWRAALNEALSLHAG